MKAGVPWSVKGVEPEAREAAKAKARRAGLTLGAWLNQVIRESGGVELQDSELQRWVGENDEGEPGPDLSEVTTRIDALEQLQNQANREIEQALVENWRRATGEDPPTDAFANATMAISIELGKRFDFMVYPNRTHSISEGSGTSLHVQALIARYFLDHLTPGSKPTKVSSINSATLSTRLCASGCAARINATRRSRRSGRDQTAGCPGGR